MYWSVAADFNGDGRPDLAAPDNRVTSNIGGFSIVLAAPGGGYSAPVPMPVGFLVSNLRGADFNRDGRADLLLCGGATAVVLSNGNGTFAAPRYITMPVTSQAGGNCTSVDLNGDGFQDALVPGTGGLAVALGNGDGSFRPATLNAMALAPVYVATGDFNNDGRVDALATVNSVSTSSVFLGNGDGTFQPAVTTLPLTYGAQVGDFNGDGRLDVVSQTAQARQDGSNYAISIALGQGDGRFISYSNYVFPLPFRGTEVGDFDGDGKLDIATYLATTGKVTVLAGRGDGSLAGTIYEMPLANGPFLLLGADVDGNGSNDLVVSSYPEYTVFRNPRGIPPLPGLLTLNPPSVIGGAANSTATVTLGGPAPVETAITLASSNPAASFPAGAAVVIPAGATSATFSIATSAVPAATAVTIGATAAGVTQTARLDLVSAFVLTGLSANPASQYGIFTTAGVVTLSGPAASSTVVSLVSSNPALAAVPASVAVPAGSATANFPVTLRPVAADTAVTLSASMDGIAKSAVVTVLAPRDTVAISKASYTARSFQLKVEATSTSNATTVTVYNTATGALLGTLSNAGGGKYNGTLAVNLPGAAPSITLKSALGGTTAGVVEVK